MADSNSLVNPSYMCHMLQTEPAEGGPKIWGGGHSVCFASVLFSIPAKYVG